MFCKNCGTQLKDGATFCTECGQNVISAGGRTGGGNVAVPPPNIPVPPTSPMQSTPVQPVQNTPVQPTPVQPTQSTPVQPTQPNMNRQQPTQPAQSAQPAKKKGHTAIIVIAAILGTIVLGFIALVIIGINVSDTEMAEATGEATVTEAEVTKEGTTANPEAIKQILALMEETSNTTNTQADKMGEFEDWNVVLETGNKWYEELEDQYKRSQEIEGLPENIKKAAADSYKMYMSAIECMNKDIVFLQGVMELNNTINVEDLTSTYYDFEAKLAEVDCPDNMKDSWSEMGESLNVLGTAVNRYVEGGELNDSLRVFSANNHLIRFMTVYENETSKIGDIMVDEMEFMTEQIGEVGSIIGEIERAAKLPEGELEQYEFKYDIENKLVDPKYEHIENIYPSLYNTYDSFVTIKIGCLYGERDIIVECEIPGLSQNTSQSYKIGSGLTELNIKPPASSEKLSLDTAKDTQIKVTIKDKKDGSTIDAQSFPVHIYGRNDFAWYSDEFGTVTQDNILCFLAPDSETVTELKRNAIDILNEMSGGEINALAGYQGPYFAEDSDGDGYIDNTDKAQMVTTFLQAASLMRSMSDMGVRYTNDSFSIDQAGQHILFPDQVIDKKTGLCIESSLVIASALQSMGMHTCLVFPPGHAQVAVETWDGSGSWLLIETTALPNENSAFVDDANAILSGWKTEFDDFPIAVYTPDQWAEYLVQDPEDDSDDCYVLDCGDGALLGMTPFAY